MKTKCLYFGDNTFFINFLKNEPSIEFHLRRYVNSTISFLHENPDVECFIFDAPEETKVAKEYINFFVKHFQNQKILFVIANNAKQQKELFINGVSDVFLKDTSCEKIIKRLSFLQQNKISFTQGSPSPETYKVKIPVWKRTMDILFALFAITILSPVLFIIALAIRLESKGKVFYAAKRIGSGYKTFDFYKFRSMYTGADKKVDQLLSQNQYIKNEATVADSENRANSENTMLFGDEASIEEQQFLLERKEKQDKSFFKMVNDPRITKVGRILRNTSLDELPQLFNILKGDMSVVGNRPLPLYEAETLTSDRWAKRFLAPAGLTGLWQVTKRGGSNELTPDERKQLDIDYANNYSFWGDLKIMLKTIPALVQHENV